MSEELKARPRATWAEAPPPARGKRYEILSPKPFRPVSCVIISERPVGLFTHYVDERTRPCTLASGDCPYCTGPYKARWKGYLGVLELTKGREAILEVTKNAYDANEFLRDKTKNLRGMACKAARLGAAKNGKVVFTLEAKSPSQHLPPEFDLPDALCRIWHLLEE